MRRFLPLLLFVLLVSPLLVVGAEGAAIQVGGDNTDCTTLTGLAQADCLAKGTALQAGFNTNATSLPLILGFLVQALLGLLGIVFLLLTIYGGYTWMMAGGNEEEVGKAKSLITNAVIGLLVVLASYALYVFVGGFLGIV